MNILLVDDEADVRKSLSRFLQKLGHSVICAADGMEALREFHTHEINLVIDPGKLEPEELLVEMVIGQKEGNGFTEPPECISLRPHGRDSDGALTFFISYTVRKNGAYAYGIRVLPHHPHLAAKQDTGLVYWG